MGLSGVDESANTNRVIRAPRVGGSGCTLPASECTDKWMFPSTNVHTQRARCVVPNAGLSRAPVAATNLSYFSCFVVGECSHRRSCKVAISIEGTQATDSALCESRSTVGARSAPIKHCGGTASVLPAGAFPGRLGHPMLE